jgi:two-component system, NarL family, response regulator NreC
VRSLTIILADDHHLVRQGLRALLEAEEDWSVIGEAANGLEAVELVERLKPRMLIVDLMMPGLNGLEVTRQVTQRCPQTRVILLSMHANEPYVMEALRHGAGGYVLKDSSAAELIQAVREVAAGHHYLSPPLSERAIHAYIQRANATALDPYDTLTSREREVLHLAAEGLNNQEIAARLIISPRTAETHRTNLMRKLGLRNQTDLIRYALRRGILPME